MLSEYKICGNMTKYINIYNAYHMYVLNRLYVSFFEELGKQAASVGVLYITDYCISVWL